MACRLLRRMRFHTRFAFRGSLIEAEHALCHRQLAGIWTAGYRPVEPVTILRMTSASVNDLGMQQDPSKMRFRRFANGIFVDFAATKPSWQTCDILRASPHNVISHDVVLFRVALTKAIQ